MYILLTVVLKLVDKLVFPIVSSVLFLLMLNSSYIIHLFFLILICLKFDSDKLKKPNERALRSIYQDKDSDYHSLLTMHAGQTRQHYLVTDYTEYCNISL